MVKIILVGDSGVGKTNLLRRYTKDDFDSDMWATIGVDFSAMEYDYKGRIIKV
jgi:GTPase SAR1 family protein